MLIDKNYIKDFRTLNLPFCECGKFKIPVEEIAEIRCEATDEPFRNTCARRIWDGYIKITPEGGKVCEESYNGEECEINGECGDCSDERYTLSLHVECFGTATGFSLERDDGTEEKFSLPYDPLIESICNKEIENSNCPSARVDKEGFIIIGIGKSSEAPSRTDNNFDELIGGWDELFGNYKPDVLKAELRYIENFEEKDGAQGLFIEFELLNKRVKYEPLSLVCYGCENCVVRISYPCSGEIELNMSRLANGNIFVDLAGCGFTFECKNIRQDNDD